MNCLVKIIFCLIALRSLSVSDVSAQTAGADTQKNKDKIEEAHRELFRPKPDPEGAAARFTQRVSASLPGSSSGVKIERKNLIDEHLFGRMERDGVPHAPLSSDEEFVRRVYVDATGQLPVGSNRFANSWRTAILASATS